MTVDVLVDGISVYLKLFLICCEILF